MEELEIEELIGQLRALFDDNGFNWARAEAEASVDPTWHPRWLAHALIVAAEDVTVNLARTELAMIATFGREVEFKPDEAANPGNDGFNTDGVADYSRGAMVGRLREDERVMMLGNLSELQASFQELKGRLDVQF